MNEPYKRLKRQGIWTLPGFDVPLVTLGVEGVIARALADLLGEHIP